LPDVLERGGEGKASHIFTGARRIKERSQVNANRKAHAMENIERVKDLLNFTN